MLQSLRRCQITRPGRSPPCDIHCCPQPYVTSIAVDAEAAMQQAMVSAGKTKTALMMNDEIVPLPTSLLVASNIHRRHACDRVRECCFREFALWRGVAVPSQCIFARKRVAALVAQVVALFQMHLEICQ
jgi:hypothetical protein